MSASIRSPRAALAGSFLCVLLNPVVMGFYSFTIFFETLAKELGWGRGILGLAITVGTISTAIAAPIVGRFADRGHARKIILASVLGLVLVVASLAILGRFLLSLYFAFGLIGVLTAGYFVCIPRIIASWFNARRGLALGIVMSGTGLGSALVAPIAALVIERAGWQVAYLVLAALVLVISLPAAWLLIDEAPGAAAVSKSGAAAVTSRPRVGGQLLLLALAFLLIGIGLHGVLIHFSPILTNHGLSPASAAATFSVASIAMFLGRLGCGYLLDRLPANLVAAALVAVGSAGIFLLQRGQDPVTIDVAAVMFGLGVGAELDALSYIVSRLYSIEHFSRFFAFAYSAFMIGTSIGPPLTGVMFDIRGDYSVAAWLATGMTFLASLVLLAMERSAVPTLTGVGEMQ